MIVTAKQVSDSVLEQYCTVKNTENCLRDMLLRGLESSRVVRDSTTCCSVCSQGKVPYTRLDILKVGARQYRKKPTVVREISVKLKEKLELELKRERDCIIAEQPQSQILGAQYMCCDAVIHEICCRANSITCVEDLSNIPLLREELRSRFYDVVIGAVGNAPPAKKQRRK